MVSGVQLAQSLQGSETFGQRTYAYLGRAVRYMRETGYASLTPKSLTHLFYRYIKPITFAASAVTALIANRFVPLSESPIAVSIFAVGGMIAIYLVAKMKDKELLWDSIGEDPELVKICLEAGVSPNSIPEEVDFSFAGINLHKACIRLDTESLKHLIEAGVDLQAVDYKGRTALIFLCDGFRHPSDLDGSTVALEIATILIEHGIDLIKTDEKGNTALHLAIRFGHLEIARKILQTGFNPNARNLEQFTPLIFLCNSFMNPFLASLFFVDRELALIDLLVEYHADVNTLGGYNAAALHVIAFADIQTPKAAERLLEHQADPNIKGKNGDTPLMLACRYGNIDTIKVLLKGGADIHAQTDEEHSEAPNCTALDVALHPDNPLEDSLKRRALRILLDAGAQVKKYTDSPLLVQVAQKKYSPAVLRL